MGKLLTTQNKKQNKKQDWKHKSLTKKTDIAFNQLKHTGQAGAVTVAGYFAAALPLIPNVVFVLPLLITLLFAALFVRTMTK